MSWNCLENTIGSIDRFFLFIYSFKFFVFRDIAGSLANDNENMRDHMRQTEHDTIDVVTFLKKQDVDKDAEVNY